MRKSVIAVLFLSCSTLSYADSANLFPQRPVTIVVPFTPGGAVDMVARTVAAELSTQWSQPVVVENKPGGGGVIGIQSVVRAKPDGYTMLLGSVGTITINPSLRPVNYDVKKELAPIVLLAKTPAVLVTLPSSPADSVSQFIQWAKSTPNGLNYGSAGVGNITHLVSEYFMSRAHVNANHIPFKGSAPAITDMLGGQVDFMFDVVPTAQPFIKSGKFKPLAVTTIKRSEAIPEVPTLDELGYKGFDVSSWFALMAPSGTPKEVIGKINTSANVALRSNAVRERLTSFGAYSAGGTPEQFDQLVKAETERWKKVIKDSGISAGQ